MEVFAASDFDEYRMVYDDPHRVLEPLKREADAVAQALSALVTAGILPHDSYDAAKMLAMRSAIARDFEIPWTAVTPRMQRLVYAINAIAQPRVVIAAGVFCGNTFIANAGAAVGPGACYEAKDLVGVEIRPDEAARAERNVRGIDPTGTARIVAADAVEFVAGYADSIDLLYIDADGAGGRGKGVYLDIVEACYDKLPSGALVLAHNSHNAAANLKHYMRFVRDRSKFRQSVNVLIDPEGIEVSKK